MCITIPSSANVKRARQWVVWQWLSASPLRLYLVGGGLLLIVALGVALTGSGEVSAWSHFNFLFALVPLLLLGALFEWLPGLLKVTSPTYVRYASLFFLLLLSQLLFHATALWTGAPGLLYLLSLGVAWIGALLTLRGMLKLSYLPLVSTANLLFYLLSLAAVTGLLIVVGMLAGWLTPLPAYTWGGVMPLYLIALAILLLLRFRPRTSILH
jgi:hypothetical protein